ncbi:MAG: hypothetical protein WCA46_05170 [Actinocatenispora sp.]
MPGPSRRPYRIVPVLAGLLLALAGCGGSGDPGTASADPTPTYVGGWPRDKGDHPGRPVRVTTDSGYRYTITSLGGGLTPQYGTRSAPPGRMFPFVVVLVHNDLSDRTTPFLAGPDLAVVVPEGAGFEDDTGNCVGAMAKGFCGEQALCSYQSTPGGPATALDIGSPDSPNNVLAAGGTWRMTCWAGVDDTVYPVKDTVDPTRIRLFRQTDLVRRTYQEIPAGA